jgi:hypothetical protein
LPLLPPDGGVSPATPLGAAAPFLADLRTLSTGAAADSAPYTPGAVLRPSSPSASTAPANSLLLVASSSSFSTAAPALLRLDLFCFAAPRPSSASFPLRFEPAEAGPGAGAEAAGEPPPPPLLLPPLAAPPPPIVARRQASSSAASAAAARLRVKRVEPEAAWPGAPPPMPGEGAALPLLLLRPAGPPEPLDRRPRPTSASSSSSSSSSSSASSSSPRSAASSSSSLSSSSSMPTAPAMPPAAAPPRPPPSPSSSSSAPSRLCTEDASECERTGRVRKPPLRPPCACERKRWCLLLPWCDWCCGRPPSSDW